MTKVLVTGGCGYLGAQLLRDLPAALPGATVRVLDNLSRSTHAALMDLPAGVRYEFIEGDLLDPTLLAHVLGGVDVVVHLAAVVRTPMAFDNPDLMQHVNHWGTARLAEACLQTGVPKVVYTSSSAVYGPGGPFDEDSPTRPVGPYGTSKRLAEEALEGAAARGLGVKVLRLGMLHGLGHATRFEGLVNHLAFQVATGRSVPIRGSGTQRRPVVHVRDAAAALVLALTDERMPGVLNVAAENPSVNEVAMILREEEPTARLRYVDQDALTRLTIELDSRRASDGGWKPSFSVRESLREILARFKGVGPGGHLQTDLYD